MKTWLGPPQSRVEGLRHVEGKACSKVWFVGRWVGGVLNFGLVGWLVTTIGLLAGWLVPGFLGCLAGCPESCMVGWMDGCIVES